MAIHFIKDENIRKGEAICHIHPDDFELIKDYDFNKEVNFKTKNNS